MTVEITQKHELSMIRTSPNGKKYQGVCFKRGYNSKKDAKAFMKKFTWLKRKLKCVYECDKCGKWHLTHLTPKEYEQKKRDYALIRLLECDLYQGGK